MMTKPQRFSMNSSARQAAVAILARSAQSGGMLRKKLIERGYTDEEADEAVEYCEEKRYFNDLEYSKRVLESFTRRGYGTRRAADYLREKLVPREVIQEAIGEHEPEDSGEILAKLIKKLHRGEWTIKEKNRVAAALARRGFSATRAALEEAIAADMEEE